MLVTQSEFARLIGVTPQSVRMAIINGRVRVFNAANRPVSPNYDGRKFLRWPSARHDYWTNALRLDDRVLREIAALEAEGDD